MHQLSKYAQWKHLGQGTSGSSNFTGSVVDLAHAAGAAFGLWVSSTVANAVTMKIQGSPTTASTDYQDLLGATKSAAGATEFAVVDVYRPKFRYLRPVVEATTEEAFMVSGCLYGWNVNPPATTSVKAVVGVGT